MVTNGRLCWPPVGRTLLSRVAMFCGSAGEAPCLVSGRSSSVRQGRGVSTEMSTRPWSRVNERDGPSQDVKSRPACHLRQGTKSPSWITKPVKSGDRMRVKPVVKSANKPAATGTLNADIGRFVSPSWGEAAQWHIFPQRFRLTRLVDVGAVFNALKP